jgi:hypothetical protein
LEPFDIGGSGTFVYAATASARPGFAKPWAVDMWVLCGEKPPRCELVLSDDSDADPFSDPITGVGRIATTVRCPARKKLLTAGGSLAPLAVPAGGRIALSEITPASDGQSATAAEVEDMTAGSRRRNSPCCRWGLRQQPRRLSGGLRQ